MQKFSQHLMEDAIEDAPSLTTNGKSSAASDEKIDAIKGDGEEEPKLESFASHARPAARRVLRESEHEVFASELGFKPIEGKNQSYTFPEQLSYGGRSWTKNSSGGEFWNGSVLEHVSYRDAYGNILKVKNAGAPITEALDGSINATAKVDRVCDMNNCPIKAGDRYALAVDKGKTLHLCRNCAAVHRRRLSGRARYGAMKDLGLKRAPNGMWEQREPLAEAKAPLTDKIARAAAQDAANDAMRKGGRTSWSEDDYQIAVNTFNKLMGKDHGRYGISEHRQINERTFDGGPEKDITGMKVKRGQTVKDRSTTGPETTKVITRITKDSVELQDKRHADKGVAAEVSGFESVSGQKFWQLVRRGFYVIESNGETTPTTHPPNFKDAQSFRAHVNSLAARKEQDVRDGKLSEDAAETCIYCNEHPVDRKFDPYCSSHCAQNARNDNELDEAMHDGVKLIDTRSLASRQNTVNKYLSDVIGRGYHVHIPLREIFAKLRENGFEPVQEDGEPWEGMLLGRDSKANIQLNTQSNGKPATRHLSISYYKMDVSGKYEVTAYVS